MDFVKAQFDRIQQQLAGLSASQKMLTGTLITIMIMTMLWWGKYAGTAEMEPVLNQSLADEDISRITSQLSAKGINHTVSADKKILVPADKRWEVLADLGYSQLLPRNTETGFETIIKQMGPWDPASKTEKFWNRATEITLSRVISGFPDVASAIVLVDPTRQRSFDGGGVQPSATINITMRPGMTATKKLVNAAADFVAGAQSSLSKERISVIVDGVSQKVQGVAGRGGMGDDYIDLKEQHERRLANKISENLSFIRGVVVAVTVDLETKSVAETRVDYDPTKVVVKENETHSHTEEATGGAGGNNEAGALANVGGVAVSGGGGSGGSTITDEKATFTVLPSKSEQMINNPAGKETVLGASVHVPRSYFAAMWMNKNPNGKEPDDAVLQPLEDAVLPSIRDAVKKCTGLKNDADISVETFWDVMPVAAMASTSSITSSIPLSLAGYAKEIAVGLLAVGSLGMMAMLVRKSTPAPVIRMATESRGPQHLETGELIAGEVSEGGAMLDGMEMDPDAIKTQQMLDQVSTLVKENPDGAANLVKRWMNRT